MSDAALMAHVGALVVHRTISPLAMSKELMARRKRARKVKAAPSDW